MLFQAQKISYEWHRWFAWYPVPINTSHDHAWLEFVERRNPGGAAEVTKRINYRLPGAREYGTSAPQP